MRTQPSHCERGRQADAAAYNLACIGIGAGSTVAIYTPDDDLPCDEQRRFEQELLSAAGLSASGLDTVLEHGWSALREALVPHLHVTKAQLVRLLQRMGVLGHAVRPWV